MNMHECVLINIHECICSRLCISMSVSSFVLCMEERDSIASEYTY